jgi:hypothetical protein
VATLATQLPRIARIACARAYISGSAASRQVVGSRSRGYRIAR